MVTATKKHDLVYKPPVHITQYINKQGLSLSRPISLTPCRVLELNS